MTKLSDILVRPELDMLQALQRIEQGSAQIVLVVDAGNRLLGTVTDGDVRRAILRGVRLDAPVSAVMNANPMSIEDGMSQEAAIALMRDKVLHQLPVVDRERRVVGLITLDAVLRAFRGDTTVVLMAGGLGSRLRPLTDATPKPLLPIGGRPLIEITIENLARQGFGRFLLSVNYKADMFREHFGDGQRFGVEIGYLEESEQLGTAGALRLLPDRPGTPILVMNGDILTALDARLLMLHHREQGAPATMCVREYDWKVPYGVVRMDGGGRLAAFEEKPSRREFVNAGIYVLSPEALELLPPAGAVDMPTLFDLVSARLAAPAVYRLREYWLDIGHLDDLRRAQAELPSLFP
jgi:dTDP-glucose pyrophosphorylase/predicted transcriptional regulator